MENQHSPAMFTPQDGNRVLLYLAAIALAVGSVFATWGTVPVTFGFGPPMSDGTAYKEVPGTGSGGLKVLVTGREGWVLIGSFRVPLTYAAVATTAGLLGVLLNGLGLAAVSRLLLFGPLLFGLVVSGWTVAQIWPQGVLWPKGIVGPGGFMLLGASAFGLQQWWRQRLPKPGATEQRQA